jgi:aspartyl-tRNA(Asn)/glutamyl-tRNA(Gln) amidotransferase subunit A
VRRLIADGLSRRVQRCDVIVGPTRADHGVPVGAKIDDPVQMYLNDIFTIART